MGLSFLLRDSGHLYRASAIISEVQHSFITSSKHTRLQIDARGLTEPSICFDAQECQPKRSSPRPDSILGGLSWRMFRLMFYQGREYYAIE